MLNYLSLIFVFVTVTSFSEIYETFGINYPRLTINTEIPIDSPLESGTHYAFVTGERQNGYYIVKAVTKHKIAPNEVDMTVQGVNTQIRSFVNTFVLNAKAAKAIFYPEKHIKGQSLFSIQLMRFRERRLYIEAVIESHDKTYEKLRKLKNEGKIYKNTYLFENDELVQIGNDYREAVDFIEEILGEQPEFYLLRIKKQPTFTVGFVEVMYRLKNNLVKNEKKELLMNNKPFWIIYHDYIKLMLHKIKNIYNTFKIIPDEDFYSDGEKK